MSILAAAIIATVISFLLYQWREWYHGQLIPDLTGKRVLITGTDTGFGHRLALDLDKLGVVVYAGCFTQAGAEKLKREASSRIKVLRLDVTDEASIKAARDFVSKDLPKGQGLWALVNNAGVANGTLVFPFAQMQDYRRVMEVNFFGVVAMNETFLPLIKKAKGRIVNLISIMGRSSLSAGPYCSSKFALEPYSDGLRRALKPFGVSVSIIEPGFFPTNMVDKDFWGRDIDSAWQRLPKSLKEEYGEPYHVGIRKLLSDFATKPPLSGNNKVEDVTNSITQAIQAAHPKYRYVCGIDCYLLYVPLAYLPECVLDFLLNFHLKKVPIAALKK